MYLIEPAGANDLGVVRELLLEYAEELGVDLSFQDFDREIESLSSFYLLILLARAESAAEAAGCVALRTIDDSTCEMKRLYLRRAARGSGIGRHLAEALIDEARCRGFKKMRLDTLPQMAAAFRLYRSLGFVEIPPYRHNPVAGTKYLELEL